MNENIHQVIDSVEALENEIARVKRSAGEVCDIHAGAGGRHIQSGGNRGKYGKNTACEDGGRRDRHGRR